jgi:hypothetical protein
MPAVNPWSYPIPILTLNPPLMTYPGPIFADAGCESLIVSDSDTDFESTADEPSRPALRRDPADAAPTTRQLLDKYDVPVLSVDSSSSSPYPHVYRTAFRPCDKFKFRLPQFLKPLRKPRFELEAPVRRGLCSRLSVFPSLRPVHSLVPRSRYLTNYMFYALTHQ